MFGEGGFLDVREESCGVESGGGGPCNKSRLLQICKVFKLILSIGGAQRKCAGLAIYNRLKESPV